MSKEVTRPLKAFLCHASGDKPVVREMYKRLAFEGVDAWLDKEKLLPGQDWQSEIHQAIYSSDIVIVCLSKQFNKQGGYRHEELRIALEKASGLPDNMILIIPVRLEECDMPEALHRWQRVDLFETNGFTALLSALEQHVAQR
jgi:hypothetical protein